MGLFDVIKSYVQRTRSYLSRKIPLDDFGGDNFLEVLDFSESYHPMDLGNAYDVMDEWYAIEDALEDRFLDDMPDDGAEFVTQFYDANSAADYVNDAPDGVLMVYAEYGEDEEYVFNVYRFDSGGG